MADSGAAGAPVKAMPSEREVLRQEVITLLPDGEQWMKTPHGLLGGETPEHRIESGDLSTVRDLVYSIVYVGIS
jgi:hypothetical protein